MKKILALASFCVVIVLSSCGNGGNTPVVTLSGPDSSSKGDTLQTTLTFTPDSTRSFTISDLIKFNSPVYALYAIISLNGTDSMYHLKIQEIDYKMTQMALYIEATNTTPTGIYQVVRNSSTLTDYSQGKNRTYAISLGSTVNITQSSYPIRGTLNLGLYYNHDSITATGNFKIYN